MTASQTVSVTIHNLTDRPITRKGLHLMSGEWSDDAQVPPNVIPPKGSESFGAESVGLEGTEGWVDFEAGRPPGFRVSWNLPFVGGTNHLRVEGGDRTPEIKVTGHRDGEGDHLDLLVTVENTIVMGSVTIKAGAHVEVDAAPDAVSWARVGVLTPERIDVVAGTRNPSGGIAHRYFSPDLAGFSDWETVGPNYQLDSGVAVSSWAEGRLDLFAIDGAGRLQHAWFDTSQGGWGKWDNLGGGLLPIAPAAVSWGLNRIDVFAHGAGTALVHAWYDGATWDREELRGLGGPDGPTSGLGVASRGVNDLHLFGIDAEGTLQSLTFGDGGGWRGWRPVSSRFANAPKAGEPGKVSGPLVVQPGQAPRAIAVGSDLFVYARRDDTHIDQFLSHDSGENWQRTTPIRVQSGKLAGGVGVSGGSAGRIDVFACGDGDVLHHFWSADAGTDFAHEVL